MSKKHHKSTRNRRKFKKFKLKLPISESEDLITEELIKEAKYLSTISLLEELDDLGLVFLQAELKKLINEKNFKEIDADLRKPGKFYELATTMFDKGELTSDETDFLKLTKFSELEKNDNCDGIKFIDFLQSTNNGDIPKFKIKRQKNTVNSPKSTPEEIDFSNRSSSKDEFRGKILKDFFKDNLKENPSMTIHDALKKRLDSPKNTYYTMFVERFRGVSPSSSGSMFSSIEDQPKDIKTKVDKIKVKIKNIFNSDNCYRLLKEEGCEFLLKKVGSALRKREDFRTKEKRRSFTIDMNLVNDTLVKDYTIIVGSIQKRSIKTLLNALEEQIRMPSLKKILIQKLKANWNKIFQDINKAKEFTLDQLRIMIKYWHEINETSIPESIIEELYGDWWNLLNDNNSDIDFTDHRILLMLNFWADVLKYAEKTLPEKEFKDFTDKAKNIGLPTKNEPIVSPISANYVQDTFDHAVTGIRTKEYHDRNDDMPTMENKKHNRCAITNTTTAKITHKIFTALNNSDENHFFREMQKNVIDNLVDRSKKLLGYTPFSKKNPKPKEQLPESSTPKKTQSEIVIDYVVQDFHRTLSITKMLGNAEAEQDAKNNMNETINTYLLKNAATSNICASDDPKDPKNILHNIGVVLINTIFAAPILLKSAITSRNCFWSFRGKKDFQQKEALTTSIANSHKSQSLNMRPRQEIRG